MPKSRGRKHTKHTRRTKPAAGSWQSTLVRAGRTLAQPTTDRGTAEQFASQVLGSVWVERGLGDIEVLDEWLHDLLRWVTTRRSPEAAALLAALALVIEHPAVDAELTEWGMQHLLEVSWAATRPPVPQRAYRSPDVWQDVVNWFLEYDDHVVSVITKRSEGGAVTTLALFRPESLEAWDEDVADSEGEVLPRTEVPIEEAVAALTDAQRVTEMTYPPNDDPDYAAMGHLLAARLRAIHLASRPEEDDWEPMSDEAKEDLITRFFADLELDLADDETTREIIDACLWYGDSYLTGGPLAWSPEIIELFLLDWLPRKTVFDPEVQRLAPTVVYAWTGWAMTQAGVPKRWAQEAALVALDLADDFLEQYDEGELSPATELVRRIQEAGIDVRDTDAVDEIVSAYNAEQLARRARGLS